eukprot:gene22633-29775_t
MDPELENLLAFYPDIDPEIVSRVWEESGQDYRSAMEALAEIARNPGAALPNFEAGGSSAPGGVNASAEKSSWRESEPNSLGPDPSGWDLGALNDSLNTMSMSVLQAANGISSWLGDLAGVFEPSWGDEEEEKAGHGSSSRGADEASIVTTGGMDVGRLHRRQHNTSQGGGAEPPTSQAVDVDADEEEAQTTFSNIG